jgi:hypothetical protein
VSENTGDTFLMPRVRFSDQPLRRFLLRPWFVILLAFGVNAALVPSVTALVVTTPTTSPLDTTQPPPDNPGWNNVTVGSTTRNYTYLGNGWALSAWHVGPFIGQPANLQTLTFSTGVVSVIPNQNYDVPNPSGSGLSADTDLKLVRLSSDPGLLPLTIASTALTDSIAGTAAAEVAFVGNGRSRETSQSTYMGHPGYYTTADRTKRWGKNRIENENTLFSENDTDLRHVVNIGTNEDPRHIVSMFTQFDMTGGIDYEAQAVVDDSGSAVFRKNGAQWELIGIVNTAYTHDNQPITGAFDENLTSFADLTYYRSAIMQIMNSHQAFSINGDVNLDGILSGDGSGTATTDDVTAFVQGWGWQQGSANVTSWKKGDLNLDGIVNVNDFFLMRGALVTANLGAGASALGELLGSGAVPEPTSALLAAFAIGYGLCGRRGRRRAA